MSAGHSVTVTRAGPGADYQQVTQCPIPARPGCHGLQFQPCTGATLGGTHAGPARAQAPLGPCTVTQADSPSRIVAGGAAGCNDAAAAGVLSGVERTGPPGARRRPARITGRRAPGERVRTDPSRRDIDSS